MRNRRALTVSYLVLTAAILTSAIARPAMADDDTRIPLTAVIAKTADVLQKYQEAAKPGDPSLLSADFEFKTVVDKQTTGGLSFWILTIKASKTTETTSDVNFTYKLPPKGRVTAQTAKISVDDALLKTIQAAAQAVSQTPEFKVGPSTYNFCQLTTTVAYSVKWDGNAGAGLPFSFITVSAAFDVSSNNVQQIKLTFANPTAGKCPS